MQKIANCYPYAWWRHRYINQTLLVMRLTIILLTVAMLNVRAAGLSQMITLSGKNLTLQSVFRAVEKQTGYVVFGNIKLLKDTRPVTIQVAAMPLENFLGLALKDQPIDFRIAYKTIILSRRAVVVSTEKPAAPVLEAVIPLLDILGEILDTDGAPVTGATISVKGSGKAISAGANGRFTLPGINPTDVITISAVGFTPLSFRIANNTATLVASSGQQQGEVARAADGFITVRMVRSVNDMGEIVVTALGVRRQAKSLSYSAQKIDGEKINQVRDANFANTLSGKVAGLVVTQSASGPGGSARIVLRGNRSIQGNNNALIVVDGVAIDNSTPGGQVDRDFGGQNGSDGAANINPDDIESINILKGAAASALYGSRAANGVILITTKKGKSGKLSVDINSGVAVETPMILPRFQNEYGQGNGGVFAPNGNQNWGAKITGQEVKDWTGKTVPLEAYKDNVKDYFETGLNVNNYIGINGGFDKVQTYFSYSNNNVKGMVPRNTLNRHNFNFRMNAKITDRLSADAKITYILQDIIGKPKVGEENSHILNLYKMPRNVNLEDVKDYFLTNPSTGIESQKYWTSSSIYMNPYWTINKTSFDEERNRVIGLLSLKYDITKWLNIQARATSDRYDDKTEQRFSNNTLIFAQQGGTYRVGQYDVSEFNADVLLSGNNTITPDLKLTYNLGGSLLKRKTTSQVTSANGLQIPNKFDVTFARNLGVSTGIVETELQSLYGTAQLAFKDYLFLDVTGRNDWASTLPSPHSYFYPSIGLTAVLSDMFALPEAVSFAKIRGAYTRVGNDASPYLLVQSYTFTQGGTNGFVRRDGTKSIGNLAPELTTSIELGTEIRLFNNRFGIDLTLYKTNSKNQLLRLNLAPASGFVDQYINAGNIQNKGIEVMLTAGIIRSSAFKWDMTLNFASNKNDIIEVSDVIKSALLGSSDRVAMPIVEVGGSYGDLRGSTWKKLDGQYVVNAAGRPVISDQPEIVGNFNPKFTAGLNNTFTYKNWEAGFLIDGRFGGVMVSGTEGNLAFDGSGYYTTSNRDRSWVLDGVKADGSKNTTAITAEEFWTTVGGRSVWAGVFTYDATNVRLRETILGYNFTKIPIKGLQSLRLSLVARNLFFLYRGNAKMEIQGVGERKMYFDPDINLGSGNYQGIEYGTLPATRSIGVNLKLTF